MTEIGDRITRVRQEGFVHVVSGAEGWNPYHGQQEWAEADLWLQGAIDGKAFLRYYRHLPDDLAVWRTHAALHLDVQS